jgi:hypothetical protein
MARFGGDGHEGASNGQDVRQQDDDVGCFVLP